MVSDVFWTSICLTIVRAFTTVSAGTALFPLVHMRVRVHRTVDSAIMRAFNHPGVAAVSPGGGSRIPWGQECLQARWCAPSNACGLQPRLPGGGWQLYRPVIIPAASVYVTPWMVQWCAPSTARGWQPYRQGLAAAVLFGRFFITRGCGGHPGAVRQFFWALACWCITGRWPPHPQAIW